MKCHDTDLEEGAKNDIGVRVMYMFNLAKATENEQRVEDHQWVSLLHTLSFILCHSKTFYVQIFTNFNFNFLNWKICFNFFH